MPSMTAHALIALGTVPAGEVPASAAESNYTERAFSQCQRFIALLRRAISTEPDGARLKVRRSGDDFDPYLEVVVEYETENPTARAYAIRCDREAPRRWDTDS
jgi:hypothetical protein